MSSRHCHKRPRSRDSHRETSPAKRRKSSECKQDKLDAILASLTGLKSDIAACNSRISDIEAKNAIYEAALVTSNTQENLEEITNDDQLSVLAGNEFSPSEEGGETQSLDLASKPPDRVIKPPEMAIKPPNMATQPTDNLLLSMAPLAEQVQLEQQDAVLFDPEIQANSWSPSPAFHGFLEKQFRKKLSYEQICDILDQQAIPAVDALVAPTLDLSVINQIPGQNKKYVQERDKELSVIQRSMLNVTGPLCSLHDRLEANNTVNPSELKRVVEQTLCLLGSANTQLSILRRKKVLASVNKLKIDLANQPLPNAKKWLFGEDFPAIASKEADLARGLAKNLRQNAAKQYTRSGDFKPGASANYTQADYNKYQSSRGRNKFFRSRRGQPRQNSLSFSSNGKQ